MNATSRWMEIAKYFGAPVTSVAAAQAALEDIALDAAAARAGRRVSAAVEDITPELAAHYLAQSRGNRHLSKPHISSLRRHAAAGRMLPTSQGIGFDRDGVLVDGHHRLEAIRLAGVTAQLLVVRGLDPRVREVIDTDMRLRQAGDILTMSHGTPHGKTVVSVVRMLLVIDRPTSAMKLSVAEIRAIHVAMAEHIDWAVSLPAAESSLRSAPTRAALAYARQTAPERVEEFAAALLSGECVPGTPARAMRDWLLRFSTSGGGGVGARRESALRVLNAIHAHIHGRRVAMAPRAAEPTRLYFAAAAASFFAVLDAPAAETAPVETPTTDRPSAVESAA